VPLQDEGFEHLGRRFRFCPHRAEFTESTPSKEDVAMKLGWCGPIENAAIIAKAGIGGLTANFFKLLARNRRLFATSDIIRNYRVIAARDRGEISADVTSAHPLTEAQTQALKDQLRAGVGKDVTLVTKVDPGLLGGLIVKVGSRMIDSSLRTKIESLKVAMKGTG